MWARMPGLSVAMVRDLSGIGPQATGAPGKRSARVGTQTSGTAAPALAAAFHTEVKAPFSEFSNFVTTNVQLLSQSRAITPGNSNTHNHDKGKWPVVPGKEATG